MKQMPFPAEPRVDTQDRLPKANPKRERVIRAAWKDRGGAHWNREVHGRGLEPLNIQAIKNVRAPKGRRPRPAFDNLQFQLDRIIIDGEPMTSIVCEGVVVEAWPDRTA
jgi:hypothetical protein